MSSYDPPDYVVSIYNPTYFASETASGLTTAQASALFLNKTSADTATALETFTSGIATNSIATTSLASNMTIGSSTNTGTISISTINTGNTNANPAIAIGTDAGTKTIKLNNNTNSVHCSSIDLQGSAINNITATTGQLDIGTSQTSGVLNIGNLAARTGAINIGNGTGVLPITIGSTAATATTTIRNPIMSLSYTTYPTYTNAQIGYTSSLYLSTLNGNVINTVGTQTDVLSFTSVPIGLWAISYSTRVAATSSTTPVTSTGLVIWIRITNQATSVPNDYAISSTGGNAMAFPAYPGATAFLNLPAFNGSATVLTTASSTISLRTYCSNGGQSLSLWNNGTNPGTYLTITRIG
jgi:hypothetical protein